MRTKLDEIIDKANQRVTQLGRERDEIDAALRLLADGPVRVRIDSTLTGNYAQLTLSGAGAPLQSWLLGLRTANSESVQAAADELRRALAALDREVA
jgi:hypothetical protein